MVLPLLPAPKPVLTLFSSSVESVTIPAKQKAEKKKRQGAETVEMVEVQLMDGGPEEHGGAAAESDELSLREPSGCSRSCPDSSQTPVLQPETFAGLVHLSPVCKLLSD